MVAKSIISIDRETQTVFLLNLANQWRCGMLLLSIR
jgi:hypothetical protein